MKKAINIIGICLYLTILLSCKRELGVRDYITYVTDPANGLHRIVSSGDLVYDFQYRPAEMIAISEHLRPGEKDYEKRMEQLDGTAWVNISFRTKDGGISPLRYDLRTRDDYDSRFEYFRNRVSGDIRAVLDETDTIYPSSCLFENNYNLTPQETIVAGFRLPGGKKHDGNISVRLNDRVYGNGIIKVMFTSKAIDRIPNLSNKL